MPPSVGVHKRVSRCSLAKPAGQRVQHPIRTFCSNCCDPSGKSPELSHPRSKFEPMFAPAVVLGIDPGVSRCGYGAVVAEGSRLSALACGVIRTPPGDPLPGRLCALFAELEGLVAELRPVAVAVERVFFQTNVRTAMS